MLNLHKTKEMLIDDCINKVISEATIEDGELITSFPSREFFYVEAKLTGLDDHNFRQIDDNHFNLFNVAIVHPNGYWKLLTEFQWYEYRCINTLAVALKYSENVPDKIEEDYNKYNSLRAESLKEVLDAEKHMKIVRKV